MIASEWAILITSLGSLVGAIVAGIALLKKTQGENVTTLSATIERQNAKILALEKRLDERDGDYEENMTEMRTAIAARDRHIAEQDVDLFALREHSFVLRRTLADNGIASSPPPLGRMHRAAFPPADDTSTGGPL